MENLQIPPIYIIEKIINLITYKMKKQKNKISGKNYAGHNQANLTSAKIFNKFKSNEWLTFLQARDINLKIKKGSHGIAIFKGYKHEILEIKADNGEIKEGNLHYMLGYHKVFNLDQTEPFKG